MAIPSLLAPHPASTLVTADPPAPPASWGASATGTVFDDLPPDAHIAVCCSGGGIRSAAFNLGALQVLQEQDEVYRRVSTVTAVSGGSYIAAAHAIAEHALTEQERTGTAKDRPKAYALGSPEEAHLRDHSRYLLEDWRVALAGFAHLLRGALVNVLLVSALVYVLAHAVGWLLSTAGILRGTGTEQPLVDPGAWVWLPVGLVGAAVVAMRSSSRHARASEPSAAGRLRRETGGPTRSPQRVAGALVLAALVSAVLVIGTPYAVQGLYAVGRQPGPAGAVVRTLGFSSPSGCRAIVMGEGGQAPQAACGAQAGQGDLAYANGAQGQSGGSKFGGLAAFVSALVVLVRGLLGRVQVLDQALRQSGGLRVIARRTGALARSYLLPWAGATLVVTVFGLLFLRWVGAAEATALVSGPWWSSQLATVGYAVGLLLAIKLLVDVNETSLHAFYRDRLADAYAVTRAGDAGVHPARATTLSSLRRPSPELVVCAAANCTEKGSLPPGRRAVSFTFTPQTVGLSTEPRCAGSDDRHRVDTPRFERGDHRGPSRAHADGFTLFDAVAVSGAAVSPVMGKLTRLSHRMVFTLANVRLGLWLRPPWWLREHPDQPARDDESWPLRVRREALRRLRQPDVTRLWAEAFGTLHLNGRWIYVTDGGHYENLGLVEALRRRPDLVVVLDASADSATLAGTLGQAVALARTECGVQLNLDPRATAPGPDGLSDTATVLGSFSYPEEPEHRHPVVYARLAVPRDAPWDVQAYGAAHPSFPTDSTLQQLYDADEFEAYRALGSHVAKAVLRTPVSSARVAGA